MSCLVNAPNGANVNCVNYLSEAVAAIITDPSFNWASVSAVDNIESLRVILQETRKGFIVEFNGTAPTNAEPVNETTGYGQTITTAINAPSLIGYAKSNPCDFNEMLSAFNGGTYNVAFFLKSGGIMLVDNLQAKSPSLRGFRTQVYAINVGVPGRENQTQNFRIQMNFQSADEFRKYKVINVHYGFNDLLELLPVGLQADVITPFDGTQVVLNVYDRCVADSPKSGVLTAELQSGTQGLTITATPTDDGGGQYTVVVQKMGPADLGTGEYARFFLCSKTGNVYDEISNIIEVEA